MEEATYRGISINATVSFSVAQALAAAEAVERGLRAPRRRGPSHRPDGAGDHDHDGPPRGLAARRRRRDGLTVHPSALPWSGVAVFKRAYAEWRVARLPGAPARRRHPPSPALVGAHRRRRRHHPAAGLAAALQRLVGGGSPAHRRPGRSSPISPSCERCRTSCARSSRTALPSPSSTRGARPSRRCARSSARITTCSTSSARRSWRDRSDLRLPPGEAVTPERAGWRYLSFAVHELSQPMQVGGNGHRDRDRRAGRWRVRASASSSSPGAHRCGTGCRRRRTCRPVESATVEPLDGSLTVAVAKRAGLGREPRADAPGPHRSGETSASRCAVRATRRGRSTTSSRPTSRPIGSRWSRSTRRRATGARWPPHKHDTDDMPREAILEEVYHYRFRRPEAWGVQRLYGGSVEGLWAVRDGETVIVRDGYHPFVATHGDDAYYLNALAGDVRTMACSFDPALRPSCDGVGLHGARSARVPLDALDTRKAPARQAEPGPVGEGTPSQISPSIRPVELVGTFSSVRSSACSAALARLVDGLSDGCRQSAVPRLPGTRAPAASRE